MDDFDFDEEVKAVVKSNKTSSSLVGRLMRDDEPSIRVEEEDLSVVSSGLNRKLLRSELEDCELYLGNLHRSFKAVKAIEQVVTLVNASMNVHKHRRGLLRVASEMGGGVDDGVYMDATGNVITVK